MGLEETRLLNTWWILQGDHAHCPTSSSSRRVAWTEGPCLERHPLEGSHAFMLSEV
jgi:hypothetical protein